MRLGTDVQVHNCEYEAGSNGTGAYVRGLLLVWAYLYVVCTCTFCVELVRFKEMWFGYIVDLYLVNVFWLIKEHMKV